MPQRNARRAVLSVSRHSDNPCLSQALIWCLNLCPYIIRLSDSHVLSLDARVLPLVGIIRQVKADPIWLIYFQIILTAEKH